MDPMLLRLLTAVGVGAGALTACGLTDKATSDSEGPTQTESTTDTESALDPDDYPQCDDPDTGAACCVDIYCIEQTDDACADASELTAEEITGLSLGSGDCQCASPAGPFVVTGEDGCCYTVGVQGCEGRPLLVRGRPQLARLVRSRAWSRA